MGRGKEDENSYVVTKQMQNHMVRQGRTSVALMGYQSIMASGFLISFSLYLSPAHEREREREREIERDREEKKK